MTAARQNVQEIERALGYWFHSIDLGQGVTTRGHKSPELLAREAESLRLPDVRGKSVLDVGAWDGFYSFEAERRGARRVVALDYFAWRGEARCTAEYERECAERGVAPEPFKNGRNLVWKESDGELLGKRRFDLACRSRGSKVESVVADFMKVDLHELGTFDVVLFLGVLYHLDNPLEGLKRLAAVTGEVAVIESQALALPGFEHLAFCEFYETNELNGDPSNWWAPNARALVGMCRTAGFRHVEIVAGPPASNRSSKSPLGRLKSWFRCGPGENEQPPVRYRAIVHAWK